MVAKLRAFSLSLFLAAAAVHAQEEAPTGAGANHIYFHPWITAITLATDKLPLFLAVTYERTLATPGNAFIWQPDLILGSVKDGDAKFSQFGATNYLGLRHYFGENYRGFYLQGSAAGSFSTVSAEFSTSNDKVDGNVTAFGAVGYVGYKWVHVFFDVGGGWQFANGTLKSDKGEEVTVSATGPALDINLGIGF